MGILDMFRRKKEQGFNAVVEGAFSDDWGTFHYITAQIQIPEGVAVIDDDIYRYKLYGVTEDFQTIQPVIGKVGDLEAKIEPLSFCKGAIPVLERPRLVCMRDGRIYVDEAMTMDVNYVAFISSIVKHAGEKFEGKEAH